MIVELAGADAFDHQLVLLLATCIGWSRRLNSHFVVLLLSVSLATLCLSIVEHDAVADLADLPFTQVFVMLNVLDRWSF